MRSVCLVRFNIIGITTAAACYAEQLNGLCELCKWQVPMCMRTKVQCAYEGPVCVWMCLRIVHVQMYELNFFVFKHIYHIPSSHPMLLTHHFFLLMSSAPAARQYYMYVTDRNRKRIGAHFWFYVANMATESLLNYRHGKDFLDTLNPTKVLMWVTIQILLSIAVVVSMVWFTTEKSKGRLSFSGSALSARHNCKGRHVDFRDGQDVCDDAGHHHHITVAASDEGDHDADAEGEDETAKVVMARQRRKR
eukprot:scpid89095/ scgid2683/ Phosphatidylserine synthase 1; Serine-exchange enzyme I